MITGTVGITVVVIFAFVAGYYLVRLTMERALPALVDDVVHLLMATVMILMPSGLSVRIPAVIQLTIFTAAALWYIYRVLYGPRADIELAGHHSAPPRLIYHSAMMLAMAAMAMVMAPIGYSSDAATSTMASMPGMPSMSSMAGMSATGHDTADASMIGDHPWAAGWMEAAGTAFSIATLWYLVRFLSSVRTPATRHVPVLFRTATDVLMALGMALTFLVVNR